MDGFEEPYWNPMQLVAWVLLRDPEWPHKCADGVTDHGSFKQELRLPDGRKEMVVTRADPPSPRKLELANSAAGKPFMQSFEVAENDVVLELQTGGLRGWGRENGKGERRLIEPVQWAGLKFLYDPMRAEPKVPYGIEGVSWYDLKFSREEAVARWPDRSVPVPHLEGGVDAPPVGSEEPESTPNPTHSLMRTPPGAQMSENWTIWQTAHYVAFGDPDPYAGEKWRRDKFIEHGVAPDKTDAALNETGRAILEDETLRVTSAFKKMERWAEAGTIQITGQRPHYGAREAIPASFWIDGEIDPVGHEFGSAHLRDPLALDYHQHEWLNLRVASSEIISACLAETEKSKQKDYLPSQSRRREAGASMSLNDRIRQFIESLHKNISDGEKHPSREADRDAARPLFGDQVGWMKIVDHYHGEFTPRASKRAGRPRNKSA